VKLTPRQVSTELKNHGYKLTQQRKTVIEAIIASEDHLTPTELYNKVHEEHPNIGLVTIYRTLDMLSEMELICELHGGGNCHSYTISSPQKHHHIVCHQCGKVADFTGCNVSEMEQRIAEESGFRIDGHLLEFTGLCRMCQKKDTAITHTGG